MNNPEMIPLGQFLIGAAAFGLGLLFIAWLALDDLKRDLDEDGDY